MRTQFIEPILASLVEQPPDGDDWIHEIKHDGYTNSPRHRRGQGAGLHAPRRRLDGEVWYDCQGTLQR
jgi:hypothetical protein